VRWRTGTHTRVTAVPALGLRLIVFGGAITGRHQHPARPSTKTKWGALSAMPAVFLIFRLTYVKPPYNPKRYVKNKLAVANKWHR
jgi:hypothetical protein